MSFEKNKLKAVVPIATGAAVVGAASAGVVLLTDSSKTATRDALHAAGYTVAAFALWEAFWHTRRFLRRGEIFKLAEAWAKNLQRPLVVIGAPDGGVTSGYGCGDVTIDLDGSTCPNSQSLDITKPLPFKDNSVVVFCSCVLEYVNDPLAAITELQRVSGGYVFYVGVEPWTLTGWLYPGTRQRLPPPYR